MAVENSLQKNYSSTKVFNKLLRNPFHSMKTALIYPPSADPTAPYLSVPILTGFLRSRGFDILPIDANIEAFDALLQPDVLKTMARKVADSLTQLKKKHSLSHTDQLAYVKLARSAYKMRHLPDHIKQAVALMRGDSPGFYDPVAYDKAIHMFDLALELISAAYSPLSLTFCGYRTPFSLLNPDEIRRDASYARSPFHYYFENILGSKLKDLGVHTVGISIAFLSQIQPAYTLALILRRLFPDMVLMAGGPAITQVFARLSEREAESALAPFDAIILFEGENILAGILSDLENGVRPHGVLRGSFCRDLGTLSAPDFDGMPLDLYYSPEPVLPYDPSRGCYWGKCAFCHYGLSERGTARYRERPLDQVTEHLKHLGERHACRIVYLSEDTLAPPTALKLAQKFKTMGTPFRFGADIRPEPHLTKEWADSLAEGGALAFSLGIESACPRILKRINKGLKVEDLYTAVTHISEAGIAAECMCFTRFPTETYHEAMETIGFLNEQKNRMSLFVCGEFGLEQGSAVAANPERFGLAETWHVKGDTFIKTLFFRETHPPTKSSRDMDRINDALDRLSGHFWFHNYPWAGSLSTAHTMLWYAHHGPDVFRRFKSLSLGAMNKDIPIDKAFEQRVYENEARIWETLSYEKRSVSPREYKNLSDSIPHVSIRRKQSKRRLK